MAAVEKVSVALSSELLALVKQAVDVGDYASSSEVVREALREWKARRTPTQDAVAPSAVLPKVEHTGLVADGLALVQSHRRALNAICSKFRVRRLQLFGSALRADFDPAKGDLDVTAEFARPRGMTSERQYVGFKAALEALFDRTVRVVELAAMPESRLKQAIERSQVVAYEQVT